MKRKNENLNEENLGSLKDLLRIVYIYPVDIIPIINNDNKISGVLMRKDILELSSDLDKLSLGYSEILNMKMAVLDEQELSDIIMKLEPDIKIPVLDKEGNIRHYWNRKDFFAIANETSSETDFFEEIVRSLPVIFIVVDKRLYIKYASTKFLKRFEFDPNFIVGQKITKFFPKIKAPDKANAGKLRINYKYIEWYYNIINLQEDKYLYIFNTKIDDEGEEKISIPASLSLPEAMESLEKCLLKKTYAETGWNITHTAEKLKIPRQTLQYKLQKYKIDSQE